MRKRSLIVLGLLGFLAALTPTAARAEKGLRARRPVVCQAMRRLEQLVPAGLRRLERVVRRSMAVVTNGQAPAVTGATEARSQDSLTEPLKNVRA